MEIWKDIEGYEGLYQVSNEGRVRSLNYYRRKGVIQELVQSNRGRGYKCVTLVKNNKKTNINVHTLVANTFILNKENKLEIDHIIPVSDEGTNNVSNLRWATRTENNNNEITKRKRSIALTNRKDQSKQVHQIDPKTGEVIHRWASLKECERNGYPSRQRIRDCFNGIIDTYKGYIWKHPM